MTVTRKVLERRACGLCLGLADLEVGEVFVDRDQRRVVELTAAGDGKRFEELLDQRGDRERNAGRLAGVQGDVEVLAVQIDPEAGRELASDDVLALQLHDAA